MNPRLEEWLNSFMAAPLESWQHYVTGARRIPGSERLDPADSLKQLYVELPDNHAAFALLDKTLTQWLPRFVEWDSPTRQQFGLSRYVYWIAEIMVAATMLPLPQLRQHLMDNFFTYRGRLTPLQLAPSRDALAEFLRVMAGSREFASNVPNFWMGLCQKAGYSIPEYYLHIGIRGLRNCPKPINEQAPLWVGGLVAWLPNASSKEQFINTFYMIKVLYPSTPSRWEKLIQPIIATLESREKVPTDRIAWLRALVREGKQSPDRSQSRPKPSALYAPHKTPYRDELQPLLKTIEDDRQAWPQVEKPLHKLLERHQHYYAQTAESYFFVRAVNFTIQKLLKCPPAYPFAQRWIEQVLEIDPWDPANWNLQGRLLVAMGKRERAEWVFWESTRRFPDNSLNYTELGQLLLKQPGREDEAEQILREAMALDSNNIPPRTELGRLYMQQGKLEEAEQVLREVIGLDSNDIHVRTELGRLYMQQGKLEEAEQVLQEAMALDSNNIPPRTELGRLYMQQGKLKEAEQVLQEAMALDSNNIPPRTELGRLYMQQGKREEARWVLEQVLDIESEDHVARGLLSRLERGEQPAARDLSQPKQSHGSVQRVAAPPQVQESDPVALVGVLVRADFRLRISEDHIPVLKKQGQQDLQGMLKQHAGMAVVSFYASRHGLTEEPLEGESLNRWAMQLDRLLLAEGVSVEARQEGLQEVARHLSGRLVKDWLKAAAGEAEAWQRLRQAVLGEAKDAGMPDDQFVKGQIGQIFKAPALQHDSPPPPWAEQRPGLQNLAARLVEANTDLFLHKVKDGEEVAA
ncbi:Tetratricopeptide TPR_2 repeat protein [Magnetococcus marinus MC-1]|uniref:Tetratricopeptide TPR_2 repeat protein n=1 Tax=Magnetococcus marinus (strain ATCC BAA-1437 / JCM 17883 / MC-1) TaxID=156889 RepID=A0L4J5_MAGMM|nr:tetratricopeptide repeat protein [Magnetococcus marinus]ABK42888.1 Tetratricopeptide TPR_2 repeat protein [Magnetococcus marinus MC-1]